MLNLADNAFAVGAARQRKTLKRRDNRSVRSWLGKLLCAGTMGIMLAALAWPVAVTSAQGLDQDAFAIEKGPHFFDNKCCFCKEVNSVRKSENGYFFSLEDGRELFVENRMIRPSVDGNQWYCPAYEGSERCGLIHVGS